MSLIYEVKKGTIVSPEELKIEIIYKWCVYEKESISYE